jgi:hypothetical protein
MPYPLQTSWLNHTHMWIPIRISWNNNSGYLYVRNAETTKILQLSTQHDRRCGTNNNFLSVFYAYQRHSRKGTVTKFWSRPQKRKEIQASVMTANDTASAASFLYTQMSVCVCVCDTERGTRLRSGLWVSHTRVSVIKPLTDSMVHYRVPRVREYFLY